MDCQMPLMDGYEATRKIREHEQFKELPVIAMTANAMKQDIEKCFSVGMNDHIAKPLDLDAMFTTMAKWIKPAAQQAKTNDSKTTEANIFDLQQLYGIDVKKSVLKSKPELYQMSLQKFYNKQVEFEQRFNTALANKPENAIIEAHSLKGLAGTLGMIKLQTLSFELESACKDDNEAIEAALAALLAELDKILASLKHTDS